jgi:DMSO/TMAO reductase YedYZ molybdopterin-dependent catalytic subunit
VPDGHDRQEAGDVSAIDRHRNRYSPDQLRRLPPGQVITGKWPVLSAGPNPRIEPASWRLRVWGRVEKEIVLSWEEFRALPRVSVRTDMHCVTRWSRLGTVWEGVPIREIIRRAPLLPGARFVVAHSYGGYTTNLPVADLLDEEVLLAGTNDGAPLTPDHGGPMRLVVPKLYAWKSAKWLNGLELIETDSNHGDPWKEERHGGD